jgi:hypothetical protein
VELGHCVEEDSYAEASSHTPEVAFRKIEVFFEALQMQHATSLV